MQNTLKDMIPDTNGDGEKIIAVCSIAAETRYKDYPILGEGDYVSDGEVILADPSADVEYSRVILNADLDADTRERFNMEVTIGDSVIFIMEEYYYDLALEMKVVAPLDTVLDEENMPEKTVTVAFPDEAKTEVFTVDASRDYEKTAEFQGNSVTLTLQQNTFAVLKRS